MHSSHSTDHLTGIGRHRMGPQAMKPFIFAMLLAISSFPVNAGVITVEEGDMFVVNVDFTGQTPGPSYTTIFLSFTGTEDSKHQVQFDKFWSGLNGSGVEQIFGPVIFGTLGVGSGATVRLFPPLYGPLFMDGIFSFQLTGITGVARWESSATGFTAQGGEASIPLTMAVPEPTSLALLSLGLAGLGYCRRKRPTQG